MTLTLETSKTFHNELHNIRSALLVIVFAGIFHGAVSRGWIIVITIIVFRAL